MPLTLSARSATTSDGDTAFCIGAVALSGSLWDANTVASYVSDPLVRLTIIEGTWPEQGINTARRIALYHAVRSAGAGGRARVVHLAIDPAVIANIPANTGARLKVADKLIRFELSAAAARGTLDVHVPRITPGSRIDNYLRTLPITETIDNGDGTVDYIIAVAPLIAMLDAPARTTLYGGV